MMTCFRDMFKEERLQEFVLTDLSDAGSLFAFKEFQRRLRDQRIGQARLRIAAKDGFMPSALYWHDSLRKDLGIGVTAVLDGSVGLPGLVVWTAAASRRISPNVRVLTGGYPSPGLREHDGALEALVGAMCCTDAKDRGRIRQRTAEEWLAKTLILGPAQLRRVFWLPQAEAAPGTGNLCR